jgi:alkanesulfonate monooxygenase SsuD/methylene tetrahydromethanopterin reductase-like flavin-dependent oxidoreductase (luciferase family)
MPQIKFGWIAPVAGTKESGQVPIVIQQEADVLPEVARRFDSLWVFDHTMGFGDLASPFLECWTTMTWLAARFPKVLVGSLVMAAGFRHPPLLAKMGASLQALSEGRFVLGIGAGWRRAEYEAYGYPYPSNAVRIAQLDEAVRIIRLMWTETAPSFQGKHYEVNEAYCFPKSNPMPPIMIGGVGEQLMLPLIARLADWWSVPPLRTLEEYKRKRDIVHKEAEAAGRDAGEIVQAYAIYSAKLPQSAEDSARWLEQLVPLVDLGVSHFMLDFGNVTSAGPIARFAEEVIAPLNAG